MEKPALSKYTVSFGLSLALASVINGLLVVAKEKNHAVMAGMKRLSGHHWITHGIFVVVLFLFFGWFLARLNGGHGVKPTINRLIGTLAAGVVLGSLIIAGFYLIAD